LCSWEASRGSWSSTVLVLTGSDAKGRAERGLYDRERPGFAGAGQAARAGCGHDWRGVADRKNHACGRHQGEGDRGKRLFK